MLRKHALNVGVLALLALPTTGLSQEKILLDLAGSRASTRSVAPNEYTFELRNIVPGSQDEYAVVVEHRLVAIPQLDPRTTPVAAGVVDGQCPHILSIVADLDSATAEERVSRLAGELRSVICEDPELARQQHFYLEQVIRRAVPGTYSLGAGQELVVTVERPGRDGPERWSLILTTGGRGEWDLGYGFVFVPRNGDEPYVEALDTDSPAFVVGNDEGEGYRFVPALFYYWTPRSAAERDWSFSLSAGLGADITDPSLFLGAAFTYNRNVSLIAGGAATQERRLRARYESPADTLSENLTADQLLQEQFEPNFFFGVSFRFGAPPFTFIDRSAEPSVSSPDE